MEPLASFLARVDQRITVADIAGQIHPRDGAIAFGPLLPGAPIEPLPDVSPLSWPAARTPPADAGGQDHVSRMVAIYSEDSEGGLASEHDLRVAPGADDVLGIVVYRVRFRRWTESPGLSLDELKTALTATLGKPKKATQKVTSWVLGPTRLSVREINHRGYGDSDVWSHSFCIELLDERQKPRVNQIPGLRDHELAKL